MTETNLTGVGDVLYGETRIATVRYHLTPTVRTGRAKGMDGAVEVIAGGPLAIVQRNYILCLDGGREIAFFVTALPNVPGGIHYMVGTIGPIVEHT
ncbi:MAG: hypothetical protein M3176_05140 [Chloroflexota bacterium]|nr:hypothetical protein [Chloroflexota bacterium]